MQARPAFQQGHADVGEFFAEAGDRLQPTSTATTVREDQTAKRGLRLFAKEVLPRLKTYKQPTVDVVSAA